MSVCERNVTRNEGMPHRSQRVIVRVYGGLGNQLFMYAAGYALARRMQLPLTIDATTGFHGDPYQRSFELGNLSITARQANGSDLGYFRGISSGYCGRVWRKAVRAGARIGALPNTTFLVEKSPDILDQRMFAPDAHGNVYVDGYWQDERYFIEYAEALRAEFRPAKTPGPRSVAIAEDIARHQAVAVHLRTMMPKPALPIDYYLESVRHLCERAQGIKVYFFADDPDHKFDLSRFNVPVANIAALKLSSSEDFSLMTQCKHHVIANSSFSWWGAWLSRERGRLVVAPDWTEWPPHAVRPAAGWTQLGRESFAGHERLQSVSA